jgi:hypothetical protein
MLCRSNGKFRWFYTGNQVGHLNHTGDLNHVAGGIPGSGLSAGATSSIFFPSEPNRALWEDDNAQLNQQLLDATYPFMELVWVADIYFKNQTFRVSSRNVYVEDEDGSPRFYEARVARPPSINLTLGEWLNPTFEIGDVTLKINNRDGYFNQFLPQGENYESWTGTEVIIRVGFGEKFENYFEIFKGFVSSKKGVESTDEEISIKCYDKFDEDEIPIPAEVFDEATYPFVQDDMKGKPIPYLYGDWETELTTDYGDIVAICTNASEESPTEWNFTIAGNGIESISEVWLHRGERKKDGPGGPIQIDLATLTEDLEGGRFSIPTSGTIFTGKYDLISKETAGASSTTGFVTASDSLNFIDRGVLAGDTIVKRTTGQQGTITTVTNGQVTFSGGFSIAEGEEYYITTYQYSYLKGDKITVKCKGKNIRNMSTSRVEDSGLVDPQPTSLSLGLDGTYWFADNDDQKIYELDFRGDIKTEIDYADLITNLPGAPTPTDISGLSYQTDNTLWFFDRAVSGVYRYDIESGNGGIYFSTLDVDGLAATLSDGRGLTIDTANYIYIVDNATNTFYVINPFGLVQPEKLYEWNISAFDAAALDITDLSLDVSEDQLLAIDRSTNKLYRLNKTTGAEAVTAISLSLLSEDITYPVGVSSSQDGTVFVLDRATKSVYNYNEFADANDNPGFIARDIIQKLTGKVADDFDLKWNETCREDLFEYKARLYIKDKTSALTYCVKFLQQFNTSLYIRFGRYSLFHYSFDNFRNDGSLIREGDIKMGSFNPSKEYSQYFNASYCDYKDNPSESKTTSSDNYVSISGVTYAGKEISKKLDMKAVYRRADVDKLMPNFVRMAAAEPEFINMTLGFKFLFAQPNDFYRISFDAPFSLEQGKKVGGRRFNLVPGFVRQITFDLNDMTMKLKMWSLGTTRFGDYVPEGNVAGGEDDRVVLTSLGTVGYVSPTGTIDSATLSTITIDDVDGADAETREAPIVGKAWLADYVIAIVDASTHEVVETAVIQSVSGGTITLTDDMSITPSATTYNSAGFITGGHYIRYADYDEVTEAQKTNWCFFCKPVSGYPASSTLEAEEQRAGLHNFDDGRIPYVLHPEDYVPS